MFFSNFNEYTRQVFKEDKEKHNVICWINYNTNYSAEEYEGLKQGECKFSYSVIENELNIGHKKALNVMKQLQEEGFILAFNKSNNRHKSSILTVNLGTSKRTSTGTSTGTSKNVEKTSVEEHKEPVKEPVQEPVKEPSSIKQSIKQSNNSGFYKEIIDYLNKKLNSRYTTRAKETQKHINARLSEGYTVEDFKTVIDKKYNEWIGTQWEKFLAPDTLFGTKFEKYLNQKITINPKDIQPDIIQDKYSKYKTY